MKAQIILENTNDKEVINVENITNKNDFFYNDSSGVLNHLVVYDDGICINRKDFDHSTYVALRRKSYIEITTEEGSLKFFSKVVEINKNFDIISIVYSVNDEVKKITIRYLGE